MKTLGQVAFEAARNETGCNMDWGQANQSKWEAAAKAVVDEVRAWLDPKTNPPPLHKTLLLKRINCMWCKGKLDSESDIQGLVGWQYPPLDEV